MTFEEQLEAASVEAARKVAERETRHAAAHGRDIVKRIRVEVRRGYRGRSVCADCHQSGRGWDD